jgi:UDP-N-acetylmuramoyl-L-alanyl-D-glutamate--2,6-diaminopimelate ligase
MKKMNKRVTKTNLTIKIRLLECLPHKVKSCFAADSYYFVGPPESNSHKVKPNSTLIKRLGVWEMETQTTPANLQSLLAQIIPRAIRPVHAAHAQRLEDIHVQSVHMDSRKVVPGSLFVCIRGHRFDGHRFASQAVEKGAVAIVAEEEVDVDVPVIIVPDTRRALAYVADRFYDSPTCKLRLIGVTGTNGKTTTTHLIEHMLEESGYKTGRMGTINMKIGDKETPLTNTTPESLELQEAFANMVNSHCTHAVVEASSHAIHMGRVRGCNFGTVVFTNLTQDHLDYHGTMEAYKQAKGLLFAQLGNRIDPDDLKFAVLNADDPAADTYRTATPAQVLTYGVNVENADIRARRIRLTPQGTTFDVTCYAGQTTVEVPLLGLFNVYNVLGAIGAGLAEGLSLEQMRDSLCTVPSVPGRMEPVDGGQDFSVVVDYAHTPDSLDNALRTVKEFAEGKIYCLIGCGGDRDRGKRPLMAQIAARHADMSVLTSDNPRSEDPQAILNDMIAGLISAEVPQNKYKSIVERQEAIEWAVKSAEPGDCILIAGKGHETYQDIGGNMFDFDDREQALQFIHKRLGV